MNIFSEYPLNIKLRLLSKGQQGHGFVNAYMIFNSVIEPKMIKKSYHNNLEQFLSEFDFCHIMLTPVDHRRI